MVDYYDTTDHTRSALTERTWKLYQCSRCGGLILAGARSNNGRLEDISEMYPTPMRVEQAIPALAREYLTQAIDSLHAPAGSVMLCASAVDAMLKDKGYVIVNLYGRIEQAAKAHLITDGMKDWAHEVRLDANDQRHADQAATLPTTADAQRSVDFAQALGQFLFVLPAQIARGHAEAQATAADGS